MQQNSNSKRRTPCFKEEEDIVLVPLANHPKPAVVDREDFERLMAAGVSDQWTFNKCGMKKYSHAYVRCAVPGSPGSLETVARMITGIGSGHKVRYFDGDPLNLRRRNLFVTKSTAKLRSASLELISRAIQRFPRSTSTRRDAPECIR